MTTIPVDRDVTDISLTVLAEPLRNPAGHWFYDAVTWGPLPWLIGSMVAFVGSVLWDRHLAAGRTVGPPPRRARQRTPTTGAAGG